MLDWELSDLSRLKTSAVIRWIRNITNCLRNLLNDLLVQWPMFSTSVIVPFAKGIMVSRLRMLERGGSGSMWRPVSRLPWESYMTSIDTFDHPLSGRYASPEMLRLHSPRHRYTTWRRLWLALAEAEQAVELYRTLYSHPSMEAITWWGFEEPSWKGAPAGFVRRADMSPKPLYKALKKLIKQDWWTGPLTLKTNAKGQVRFRGYLGDYIAKTRARQAVFSLDHAGKLSMTATLAKTSSQ